MEVGEGVDGFGGSSSLGRTEGEGDVAQETQVFLYHTAVQVFQEVRAVGSGNVAVEVGSGCGTREYPLYGPALGATDVGDVFGAFGYGGGTVGGVVAVGGDLQRRN